MRDHAIAYLVKTERDGGHADEERLMETNWSGEPAGSHRAAVAVATEPMTPAAYLSRGRLEPRRVAALDLARKW